MLDQKIKLPLLMLRLSLALVMWIWVVDKFVNPAHTVGVWSYFYFVDDLDLNMSYVIGVVQAVIVAGFTLGVAKRWTTGLLFLMHLGSTLTPFMLYLAPYDGRNILFFPAWVMLAGFYALYVLRDEDTLLTVGSASDADAEDMTDMEGA